MPCHQRDIQTVSERVEIAIVTPSNVEDEILTQRAGLQVHLKSSVPKGAVTLRMNANCQFGDERHSPRSSISVLGLPMKIANTEHRRRGIRFAFWKMFTIDYY